MLLGGYGFPSSRWAFTMKRGNQRLRLSAVGFSNKSEGHSSLLFSFCWSRHCSNVRTAQDVAFLVFGGTKPRQIVSILLGDTGEAKCGVVFFFAGSSSQLLSSISTSGGSQHAAPLAAPVCSQAVQVSTHPVSAGGILLVARATNRLTHGSFSVTRYTLGSQFITPSGVI